MENKYISIDQLWKCETCFYMGSNGKCRSDCDAVESYRPAYSKFEFADVAPVVRCGECVHALKSDQCNPDSRLCNLNYYSGSGRKIVNLDGYCHLGRRKLGEHYARTYKDDFTRHFPDCPKFKNGTPTACRDSIYPTTESGCKTGNCDICWMAVMPETDANIGDNADRCVCCGDVIPEGRQVCPGCEGGTNART